MEGSWRAHGGPLSRSAAMLDFLSFFFVFPPVPPSARARICFANFSAADRRRPPPTAADRRRPIAR